MQVPALYASPEFPGLVDMVLEPKPSTKLGKQALVGRSARELAFIAGRHLTWYRKEHVIAKPLRSIQVLEDVFLAALTIGNPGLPMTPEVKERVEPLAKMIQPLLDPTGIERLQSYFAQFVEKGGRTNLLNWLEGVDRTAASTGLLLANDLHAAHDMLLLEDPEKIEERMDELIVFFTAGRCSLLRKRIGIAVETT
jgi:hypothetical protein